jgi:hypothetical protein
MPDSLERLDLLLVHEAKERKVRPDGVHFLRLRYLSPVLAAYVGESVTVRYDPRDLGEIRVFFKDKFLCRAISAELAGATVPLREIVRSRKQRKSELQGILKSRQRAVDFLLISNAGMFPRRQMSISPFPSSPPLPNSSATATSSPDFIETLEYRRFVEFCDACRQYRYIGLCFGPPGVGETLSAMRYSRLEKIGAYDPAIEEAPLAPMLDTVFYTPLVMNSPSRVDTDIKRARETLAGMVRWPLRREAQPTRQCRQSSTS